MPATHTHILERNLKCYPAYVALFNTFAWMPIFFLFFSERFAFNQVLQLEAVYYFAVVTLEVPSGYFSDRVGRKITLILSTVFLLIAYALFLSTNSWALFAIGQIFLAGGIAFNSGTDTAFHYDTLKALGRENEYDQREASLSSLAMSASAIGALAGGIAAAFGLHMAYAVSLAIAAISFFITISFSEPEHDIPQNEPATSFSRQLLNCIKLMRKAHLLWLTAFGVVMITINHIPYEFYQKYVELVITDLNTFFASTFNLSQDTNLSAKSTPISSAIHVASTMFIASWFAGKSIKLRDRFGLGRLLISAALLQTAIIFIMSLWLHAAIIIIILFRSTPRALITAPLRAAITPLLPSHLRATYLSIISLLGRISFSAILLLMATSVTQNSTSPNDPWFQISYSLTIGGFIALTCVILLLLTVRAGLRQNTTSHKPPPIK